MWGKVLLSCLVPIIAFIVFYYSQNSILKQATPSNTLYTVEELALHDGKQKETLYLAVLGRVYDVTKGKQHYGPGQNYNIFIGRDASRSFITGEFEEIKDGLDQVMDLSLNDIIGLANWVEMYDKQYIFKGLLIGRFYDAYGQETEYLKQFYEKLSLAKSEKMEKESLKRKFPPCNAEWDVNEGSKFWCTTKSGGIERDWAGVPREYYSPESTSSHCVCINPVSDTFVAASAQFKEYEGCDKMSSTCHVKS